MSRLFATAWGRNRVGRYHAWIGMHPQTVVLGRIAVFLRLATRSTDMFEHPMMSSSVMDTTIYARNLLHTGAASKLMADRLLPSLPHGLTTLSRTTACTADDWTGQTTPDKAVFYNYTWQVCINKAGRCGSRPALAIPPPATGSSR